MASVAPEGAPQGGCFFRGEAQVISAEDEYRVLHDQAVDRQRRRLAGGDHDLARLGQAADEDVDRLVDVVGVANGVVVVQDQDEATGRAGEVGHQQAGQARAVGTLGQAAAQAGQEVIILALLGKGRRQRRCQPAEKEVRVAVAGVEAEPGHVGAALAGIARRDRAFAESSRGEQQDEGSRRMLVQPFEQSLSAKFVASGSRNPRGSLEDHGADYARMRPGVLIATVTAATFGGLIGLARGGSLAQLAQLELRLPWLAGLACLIQVALFVSPLAAGLQPWEVAIYLLTVVLLGIVVFANRALPGVGLFGLGLVLNAATMVANGGYVPVSESALRVVGDSQSLQALQGVSHARRPS